MYLPRTLILKFLLIFSLAMGWNFSAPTISYAEQSGTKIVTNPNLTAAQKKEALRKRAKEVRRLYRELSKIERLIKDSEHMNDYLVGAKALTKKKLTKANRSLSQIQRVYKKALGKFTRETQAFNRVKDKVGDGLTKAERSDFKGKLRELEREYKHAKLDWEFAKSEVAKQKKALANATAEHKEHSTAKH